MPRKAKAAKKSAAKAAPRRRKAAPKAPVPALTREEVLDLEAGALTAKRAERALQQLAAPSPDGDDSWSTVEDKLVSKEDADRHSERRWKFFAK